MLIYMESLQMLQQVTIMVILLDRKQDIIARSIRYRIYICYATFPVIERTANLLLFSNCNLAPDSNCSFRQNYIGKIVERHWFVVCQYIFARP